MNQKGITPIFIIVVVVIVGILTAGLFFLGINKNQTQSTQSNQASKNSIKNNQSSDSSQIDWNSVDKKWQVFAKYHLKKMLEIDSNTPRAKLPGYKFDTQFKEVSKSPLIAKYLPKYRFYQEFDSNGGGFRFALRSDGHIIDLGTWWPVGYHTNHNLPDFEIMNYTDFIKMQDIIVNNSETALEMINLAGAVFEYPLNDTKVNDQKSWKLKASKDKNKWVITQQYIGDPNASIFIPTSWEIIVGDNNKLEEIKEVQPKGF